MTLSPTQIPPYVSHRTFITFLESLRHGIPDRIDHSVFDSSFSGTSRKQITSALKSLELVDDELRPTPRLEVLVMSEGEAQCAEWRRLLEEAYAPVFRLDLEAATPYQLRDELRKIVTTEAMLVKCESFFKRAAVHAGITLSPHIMKRKPPRRRRRAEARPAKPAAEAVPLPAPPESVSTETFDRVAASIQLDAFTDKVLEKFPEFDPNWSEEARENWFTGIKRLNETLMPAIGEPSASNRPTNGAAN